MKTTHIYILLHPITNEIRYIGKANDIKDRYERHINPKNINTSTKKNNWIKSLHKQGLQPKIEIFDIVPFDEWQFWEEHYISLFRSWNIRLTNMTPGGEGIGRMTPEQKIKISLATSGKNNPRYGGKGTTDETRRKLRESHLNIKASQQTKDKMSISHSGTNNGMYGKCAYDIWIEKYGVEKANELKSECSKKLSENGKKLKHTEESKEKIRQKHIGTKLSQKTKDILSKDKLGRKFINNGKETKSIKFDNLNSYLQQGWKLGMLK